MAAGLRGGGRSSRSGWAPRCPGPKAVAAVLMLVVTAPVAVRRRWPLAAGSVVLGATTALALVAGYCDGPGDRACRWMCALYAIAVWTDTRRFLAGIGVLVVGQRAHLARRPHGRAGGIAIFTWVADPRDGARPRRRPRARAARRRARRARRAARARARAARARGGGGGARPHRARAARPRGPQRQRDGGPGGRRAPRARRRPGVDARDAGLDRAGRPPGAGRGAPAARDAAAQGRRRGARAAAQRRATRRARRAGRAGRAAGRRSTSRASARALPAGVDLCAYRIVQEGADQRAQARRPRARRGGCCATRRARSTSRSATTAAARRGSTATAPATG